MITSLNFISPLKRYLKLINEGASLMDKLAILLYSPMRLIDGCFNERPLLWGIKIKNADGLFKCRNSSTSVFMVSSVNEWWLREEFNVSHGIFIDIGSNIGKYSIMAGNNLNVKKIISIEPDPFNFKVLQENIQLNGLSGKILAVNAACSNKNGKLPLYLKKEGSASSLIKENLFGEAENHSKKVLVDVVSVDSITKKFNLKDISLIKIDVEGEELNVILGSLKTIHKYHPKIILECFEENKVNQIKRILSKEGYMFNHLAGNNLICNPPIHQRIE